MHIALQALQLIPDVIPILIDQADAIIGLTLRQSDEVMKHKGKFDTTAIPVLSGCKIDLSATFFGMRLDRIGNSVNTLLLLYQMVCLGLNDGRTLAVPAENRGLRTNRVRHHREPLN